MKKGGMAEHFKPESGEKIYISAFACTLWELKCERKRDREQTNTQTDKQTQTDGQKDRGGHAEEDLWESAEPCFPAASTHAYAL